MSPPGRPKGEYRSAQHEGFSVSPPGRPKGEYRSAQHEGSSVSPPGRPKGEYRSAQHEGSSVTGACRAGRRWLSGWVPLLMLALLSGCATVVPVPGSPSSTSSAPETAAGAQAAWARVLDRFVNAQGEVDFLALSQDRADLDRMLRHVANTPPDSLAAGAQRLAHLINAYNALSMFNVIDSGIPATHAGLNKVVFFISRRFNVGGQTLSLYGFENDVIRPLGRQTGDPRLHFALNCSAVSCPVLPRTPFTTDGLDDELAREARAFFARPANWRIDVAERTVWLNEILSFYTEDFVPVPARSLIEYANRYAPQPAPLDFQVRFTPYDWTVANSRRPR